MRADPKPARRVRDSEAVTRKMRNERRCRAGCGYLAMHAHHVLFRSKGGDDVEDNIIGLCFECHRAFHDADEETRRSVGAALRGREKKYLRRKLGVEPAIAFLARYYWTT